jgi:hypothetical protein
METFQVRFRYTLVHEMPSALRRHFLVSRAGDGGPVRGDLPLALFPSGLNLKVEDRGEGGNYWKGRRWKRLLPLAGERR